MCSLIPPSTESAHARAWIHHVGRARSRGHAATNISTEPWGPEFFVEDTPTAVLVRQVLGAVAEFEKTTLVAKLAAARRRKRMATGEKVEGRKSHAEARPDVAALAKRLARKKPKGGKLSLRAISAELAEQGHLNKRGRPFNPKSVAAMLTG